MATTYRSADPDAVALLAEVLRQYHPDLVEAGVTVALLLACAARHPETGEPAGPPLKLHGWPAMAVVKINSLKDRVEGKADATVTLDGDRFPDLSAAEQRATLDHECEHLALVRDDAGGIKTDDAGRPRLKLRLHDWEVAGFDAVVERHKAAALEAQQYTDLHRRMSQMTFPWG